MPRRRGRRGYGYLLIVRLLVYAMLTGIFSNRGLKTHLETNIRIAKILGFKAIPHRTTISRWKQKHYQLLFHVVNRLGDIVRLIVPTDKLIADSAPLPDPEDPDAKKGKTGRGWFIGFKIHSSINQLKIPLRAVFTTGNKHDSPIMPHLLVRANYVLGDCGYDSKSNRMLIESMGAVPVIGRNPRRTGKRYKNPAMLKKHRYKVEQHNSLHKTEVLKGYWNKVKGFARKATLAYAGIVTIQVMAINALLNGTRNLFKISLYRY